MSSEWTSYQFVYIMKLMYYIIYTYQVLLSDRFSASMWPFQGLSDLPFGDKGSLVRSWTVCLPRSNFNSLSSPTGSPIIFQAFMAFRGKLAVQLCGGVTSIKQYQTHRIHVWIIYLHTWTVKNGHMNKGKWGKVNIPVPWILRETSWSSYQPRD